MKWLVWAVLALFFGGCTHTLHRQTEDKNTQILQSKSSDVNASILPDKAAQKHKIKSYKFKNFGGYFNEDSKSLLILKDDGNFELLSFENKTKDAGNFSVSDMEILAHELRLTPTDRINVLKDSKGRAWIKNHPLKELSAYANDKFLFALAPDQSSALLSSQGMQCDGALKFHDGFYDLNGAKIVATQAKIFIEKGACNASDIELKRADATWLIAPNSLGLISSFSNNVQIIKEFGARNIKRDERAKNLSVYYVYYGTERLFSYLLQNNKVTKINILSKNYKTAHGIGLKSTYAELTNLYKISDQSFSDDEISVKVKSLNAIFKFERKFDESGISKDAKVTKILLLWE